MQYRTDPLKPYGTRALHPFLHRVTNLVTAFLAVFSTATLATAPAFGQGPATDLSTWTVESSPLANNLPIPFAVPTWRLEAGNLAVKQFRNPTPNFFYSDFRVDSHRISAELTVDAVSLDNDWIGFALGFDPGETHDAAADFVFIDWKKQTSPLQEPGTVGLAVSRAFGIPSRDEFSEHSDRSDNPLGGVQELARGTTLGNVGWQAGRTYFFDIELRPGSLKVFVDGQLEIDLTGTFGGGRFACYNHSQDSVTCANVRIEALASPSQARLLDTWNDETYRFGIEAPGSWLLSADALSAEQLNRNDASLFYSDFTVSNDRVTAELFTVDNSDDDYIGFAVGFDPGEAQDPNAEYFLIDWKKVTQSGQIGGEPFTANAGLAISRVFGLPSVAELFGHHDHTTSPAGGVVELARGANLSGVGWDIASVYVFTVEIQPTSLRVWVEDTTRTDGPRLEIDLTGDFTAAVGRFACYSNSQPRVTCANVVLEPLG